MMCQQRATSKCTPSMVPLEKLKNNSAISSRPTHLTEEQKVDFAQLLRKYHGIFAATKKDLGRTDLVKHRINTGNAPLIRKPPRRLPLGKRQVKKQEIESMLERGVIQPSTSPWASPVVLVTKKDGSKRFCVDNRAVNDLFEHQGCLPSAKNRWFFGCPEWLEMVQYNGPHVRILADNDGTSRHWKDSLHHKSRPVWIQGDAIWAGQCSSYLWELMESVLRGLQWEECLVYMDDIIVAGSSVEQCLQGLDHVFERLQAAGLKLKPSKCSFFCKNVTFLGHVVTEDGVHTDPEKIRHVKEWPVPKTVKEVRSFLGSCSFDWKFISGFTQMARPLNRLIEKTSSFVWDRACEESFTNLKEALISAPVLAYPRQAGQFFLDTDSSGWAAGAVLSQVQEGNERVIAYFSKALSKIEQEYCVTRKELLAVVLALEHFDPYLYGRQVILRTDNAEVSWMKNLRAPTGQTARWLERIQQYDLVIQHREGRSHNNADALSRKPCASCSHQHDLDQKARLEESQAKETSSAEPLVLPSDDSGSGEGKSPGEPGMTASASELVAHSTDYDCGPVIYVTTRRQNLPIEELQPNQAWLQGWDVEAMRFSQLADPMIGPLLAWMEEGRSRPSWQELSHLSDHFKALWAQWERLELCNGLLFRRSFSDRTGKCRLQLLVPQTRQREVFEHLHDHSTSGHMGLEKTSEKIRFAFFWPGLLRTVKDWCKKCDWCAARKPPLKKSRAPLQQYLFGNPMERIAVDILGPLPRTARGNTHVVVLGDYFTKWMEAFAVPNQEAATVVTVIVEQFICRFGVLRQLHTDKGSNFESELFQQVCQLLDIDKTRTSHRPQSDGMVERFNRSLGCMLTMYVEKHQNRWDEYLLYVMLAYRSSLHESTGFSPNMLMLGRELQMPIHTVVPTPMSKQ